MPLGEEPEEPAHPLIAEETGARQHPFQLPARGVNSVGAMDMFRDYILFSTMCKCMKHAFNLSGLVLSSRSGASWSLIGSQKRDPTKGGVMRIQI